MAVGEEIKLSQVRQSPGGRGGVQFYADMLLVQASEALDFLSAGQRQLGGIGKRDDGWLHNARITGKRGQAHGTVREPTRP